MRHDKRSAQLEMDGKQHAPKHHKTRAVSSIREPGELTPFVSQEIDSGGKIKVEPATDMYSVGEIKVELPDYEDNGEFNFKTEFSFISSGNGETGEDSPFQFHSDNGIKTEFSGQQGGNGGVKEEPNGQIVKLETQVKSLSPDYDLPTIEPPGQVFDFCEIKTESLFHQDGNIGFTADSV